MGAPAQAIPVMINNGLAPPNPENVTDGADDYSDDVVYVRNVGCPPGWPAAFPDDPYPPPGAATEVGVVSGGTAIYLRAYDSSTVTMSGGTVGADLEAYGTSNIILIGRRFMVDGVPVPYGDLTALTGRLTGRLASGGSLNNMFYQGGYAGSLTGTITLVAAPTIPVPALQPAAPVGLIALLLGAGLAVQRRRGEL
jgi:hypothetical protein